MKTFLFTGCGSIGRRHIRNLKALTPCKILAWRVRKEDLGDFEKETGLVSFSDYDDALDQKPDAVFITNPTSLHLTTAMKAAKRGIPLFIEKPLSHSLEGVDDFMSACEQRNLPVLLGYKMRFHPSIKKIKEILDSGVIGKVISVRAHYGGALPDWHPWEDYRRMYSARKDLGGGVILDAIHELDYLYWLMGDVSEISGMTGNFGGLGIETEDLAEAVLRFKCGALGSLSVNYVQRPEFRYCHGVGTLGTVCWDSESKQVACYESGQKKWNYFPEPAGFEPNHMFMDEMRHFLDCIEKKDKPMHTLADSRRVLEIALTLKNDSERRGVL